MMSSAPSIRKGASDQGPPQNPEGNGDLQSDGEGSIDQEEDLNQSGIVHSAPQQHTHVFHPDYLAIRNRERQVIEYIRQTNAANAAKLEFSLGSDKFNFLRNTVWFAEKEGRFDCSYLPRVVAFKLSHCPTSQWTCFGVVSCNFHANGGKHGVTQQLSLCSMTVNGLKLCSSLANKSRRKVFI